MRILNENYMKAADGQEKDAIVLVSNIKDPETEERHNKLRELGIGKSNFDLGYGGQLLVKCPKTKLNKRVETFPIVEGVKYWQATHYWEGSTV